jgi:hypothetical protein
MLRSSTSTDYPDTEDLGAVPDELPLAAVVVTAIALCLSRRDEHR